jgi:hypothetical protein
MASVPLCGVRMRFDVHTVVFWLSVCCQTALTYALVLCGSDGGGAEEC